MEEKRQFKGIWIPAYVWNNPALQPNDIQVWAEIDSFTSHDGVCFASNAWMADKFKCTIRTIQRSLIRLRDAGLIEIQLKGNPRNKETKRFIRSVAFVPTTCHESHAPMTQMSYPHDTNVTHNNTKSNNTKSNKKIKLHSPQSSEEDFQGETQGDFSSQKGQEEIQVEEKKNTNPYQLTDSDMNLLKSYQKGFIEEIDKVAKVKYDKKLIHLCKTFNLLNKDRELLKSIYIYFRTYRDHFGTYTTEIRSFKSLNEKIEKLQAEMIRETKRVIKESGSVVLHQDKEKKIAVIYKSDSMKKDDKNRIDDFKRIGYTVFDMYKTIGHIELKDLGYHVQHVY